MLAEQSLVTEFPCLLFRWARLLYGLDACAVQEIIRLPELKIISEAPDYIVGVLNLRGKIVPVIDLNWRFGYPASPNYSLDDLVIIVVQERDYFGLIVSDVQDVVHLATHQLQTAPCYCKDRHTSRFIEQMAKSDEEIIMILQCQKLLAMPDEVKPEIELESEAEDEDYYPQGTRPEDREQENQADATPSPRIFCPGATPAQRAVFRERAQLAMMALDGQWSDGLIPFAIVGIQGEYFGIPLEWAMEVATPTKITKVPCCPPHIVGQMNLRGEILTIADIRHLLRIPSGNLPTAFQIMVVGKDELRLGVIIDDVLDIIHLSQLHISTIYADHVNPQAYMNGTTLYESRVVGLLDFSKILESTELIVHDSM